MKPPNMAPVYVQLWEQATEVARDAGYCLAVHGTLQRDLDLLACPWTDEAIAPEELVRRIADRLAWLIRSDDGAEPHIVGPERKPHGRLAWSIPYMKHWQIDLSVMPRKARGPEGCQRRRGAHQCCLPVGHGGAHQSAANAGNAVVWFDDREDAV